MQLICVPRTPMNAQKCRNTFHISPMHEMPFKRGLRDDTDIYPFVEVEAHYVDACFYK